MCTVTSHRSAPDLKCPSFRLSNMSKEILGGSVFHQAQLWRLWMFHVILENLFLVTLPLGTCVLYIYYTSDLTHIKCWLFCSTGKPIFSVDIHPDGTKFATGGQGKSDTTKRKVSPSASFLRPFQSSVLQCMSCFSSLWSCSSGSLLAFLLRKCSLSCCSC